MFWCSRFLYCWKFPSILVVSAAFLLLSSRLAFSQDANGTSGARASSEQTDTNEWCGVYAVYSLCKLLGRDPRWEELVTHLGTGTSTPGMSSSEVMGILADRGLEVTAIHWDVGKVPVGQWFIIFQDRKFRTQDGSERMELGHFVVAKKLGDGRLVVHDPPKEAQILASAADFPWGAVALIPTESLPLSFWLRRYALVATFFGASLALLLVGVRQGVTFFKARAVKGNMQVA